MKNIATKISIIEEELVLRDLHDWIGRFPLKTEAFQRNN